MNAIINSCQSHLTAQQHAKLAQHYHNRHFAIACTQVIGKKPARQTLLDYAAIYQKYLYHKRAAASLRAIEAQRRTETGLLALGTVAPQTAATNTSISKIKAANVVAGKTYYRNGDTPDTAFTVLNISADYQRNSICAYRVATVRNADGAEVEYKVAANQTYVLIETK
jgi:hypothetical protein